MHRHPSITVAGVFPKQLLEDVKVAFTEGLSEEEVSCHGTEVSPTFLRYLKTLEKGQPLSTEWHYGTYHPKMWPIPTQMATFLPDLNRMEVFGLPCGVRRSWWPCKKSNLKKPQDGYNWWVANRWNLCVFSCFFILPFSVGSTPTNHLSPPIHPDIVSETLIIRRHRVH